MVVTRSDSFLVLVTLLSLLWLPASSQAQSAQPDAGGDVSSQMRPQGKWLEFRQARFNNQPILVHLRQGYERAILMPEPIRLEDDSPSLPGCAVEIDTDVVGFYPTQTFSRRPIRLIGLNTGTVYELRVRASPEGIRQPLQITR